MRIYQLSEQDDQDTGQDFATEKRELEMYIMNDQDLYRQMFMPIIMNIVRKMKRGVYDHKLAPRLWQYLVDQGAKNYVKEFGGSYLKVVNPNATAQCGCGESFAV